MSKSIYWDTSALNKHLNIMDTGPMVLEMVLPQKTSVKIPIPEWHKKCISRAMKGRTSPTKGMKLGRPSEETIEKIRKANIGKKKDNTAGLMGQAYKGKPSPASKQYYCIGCHERVSPSRIYRHKKCLVK